MRIDLEKLYLIDIDFNKGTKSRDDFEKVLIKIINFHDKNGDAIYYFLENHVNRKIKDKSLEIFSQTQISEEDIKNLTEIEENEIS